MKNIEGDIGGWHVYLDGLGMWRLCYGTALMFSTRSERSAKACLRARQREERHALL